MSKAVAVLVLLVILAGAAYLAYDSGLVEVNVSIKSKTGTGTAAPQETRTQEATAGPAASQATRTPVSTTSAGRASTSSAGTAAGGRVTVTQTVTQPAATGEAGAAGTATVAAPGLPGPWSSLELPELGVVDEMMDEGPRVMMVAAGRGDLRLRPLSYERTPYIADYSDTADFYAGEGMGFLAPRYAVLMTTLSPIGYLDRLYTGEDVKPFMVVFFPVEARDAVILDDVGTEWLLLTSKGDLVYGSAGERLEVPKQLSGNVSEARILACTHRLHHDPGLEHVGAFRSEYLDAAIAWGGDRLVIVALGNNEGFAVGCDEKPRIEYVKTVTLPEEIVWAGQYNSPTILWILTTKRLYAMPLVSYKFQTAWLHVSPEKLHPTPVADAKPFAVVASSTGSALVLLLGEDGVEARLVENEWEGVAKTGKAPVSLGGLEFERDGEKPVKIMLEQPVVGDKPLLALQYPGRVVIYSLDEEGINNGVVNATEEVSYTIRSGDDVAGYTAVLLHGDEAHDQATRERYGVGLGEDVFVSGIVVRTADGKLVGVLDYESRG